MKSSAKVARVFQGTARNLAFLAGRLRAGELVAVPTETVYGLAANALDPRACERIFAAKGRPHADPLIVHIATRQQLDQVCVPNSAARTLAEAFWPGPLTLVLPKKAAIPGIVTAGQSSVAVRMPAHPLFRRLLKLAALPLAAPSANPFGYVSPTSAAHVRDNLGSRIRYILDGGRSRIGLESTIVDLRDPRHPRVLRPGAITREMLEDTLRLRVTAPRKQKPGHAGRAQIAPGLLARHYSPRTPVVLHGKGLVAHDDREAYVFIRKPPGSTAKNVFWLDARGDLRGAARCLFATLRRLDAMRFRRINIERASGDGLADAINDRLRRAAAR